MENEIIRLRKEKISINKIALIMSISKYMVYKVCKNNGLNIIGLKGGFGGFKHTEKSKEKISISKRELYKNHPEKHNWKSGTKFISNPCENFKNILNEMNINFLSEYTPLKDRFFSADISFPDKKVIIEINGNQHYNKDGTLKDYYQERHELLEKYGWKIYELHFSICFKREVIIKTIKNIINESEILFNFDYNKYLLEKLNEKNKNRICECGSVKNKKSKFCKKCYGENHRKVKRPLYDILKKEVNDYGYCATGRKYGVSDNSIRKWLKDYSLASKLD